MSIIEEHIFNKYLYHTTIKLVVRLYYSKGADTTAYQ